VIKHGKIGTTSVLEYFVIGSFAFRLECSVLLKRSNEDLKLVEAKDLLSGPHTRRGRLSIIANILDVAKRGTIKTQIMYGASLSFSQLCDYLSFLLDANLLKVIENPNRSLYKTTNKGLRYLQGYKEIGELLKKEKENIP